MKDERITRLRKKAMALPLKPGVYIMHNKAGGIIYIGKAKMLKNRVSQYFGSDYNHTDKVRKMVSNVENFEYIVCDSEFEALILECSLIKQHTPKYNVLLKDDKGYHYIKITSGAWPSIKACMQVEKDGAEYLGPYNSGWIVKQTVEEANKIFKLPHCDKKFPRDIKKGRPCLNFYIGNCNAPCAGKINQKDYYQSVLEAIDFIRGDSKLSIEQLEEQMMKAADDLDFEKAARLRDRIAAIKRIGEKQKVIASTYKTQDVFSIVNGKNKAAIEVFVFRNSRLCDRHQFLIDSSDDLKLARADFIKQFYTLDDREIPPRIVIDDECEDRELLEQMLSEMSAKKVEIVVPQIGEQKQLIRMCLTNAAEYLAEMTHKRGGDAAALDELAKLLGLPYPPEYIESYDISHTAGSENVAGMVVFKNGMPYKRAYKRFKIKSFIGQDDCRSMAEVIERRFTEYLNAENKEEGFGRLPDLILLDGGHAQLNTVKAVLERLNINVNVFGMVKDSKHKSNAIATDGGNVQIKSNRTAFTLITKIQDEVHRFAITYHHERSRKSGTRSELLNIEGVGEATVKKLLKAFKTIKAIKSADTQELKEKGKISLKTAQNIYEFYNTEA